MIQQTWLQLGNLLRENRNLPSEPYQARPLETFEDVEQTHKEVSPAYWRLLKIAKYLCHRYTYVDADLLRQHSQDVEVEDKRIYGAVLRNKCFEGGGYVPSRVKGSHGRPIRRFRLKEPEVK